MKVGILTFFMACFGATAIVKMIAGEIELFNRRPFNCSLCSGFWITFIMFFVWKIFPHQSEGLLTAFAGAGLIWMLYKFTTGEF